MGVRVPSSQPCTSRGVWSLGVGVESLRLGVGGWGVGGGGWGWGVGGGGWGVGGGGSGVYHVVNAIEPVHLVEGLGFGV